MKRLVKAPTMAEELSLSLKSVYRLASEGQIPSVRIGRSIRFDPEAVRRALKIEADDKREGDPDE